MKFSKSGIKNLEKFCQAFGKYSFEWHTCFKTSQVLIKDDQSSAKITENMEMICEFIQGDCRQIIHQISFKKLESAGGGDLLFIENLKLFCCEQC